MENDKDGDIWDGAVIGGIRSDFEMLYVCRSYHDTPEHDKTVLVTGKLQGYSGGCYIPYHWNISIVNMKY